MTVIILVGTALPSSYLLLRLIARAGPFCYYVFFGFCIGGKGEGDAGEGGALISSCQRLSRLWLNDAQVSLTKSMPTINWALLFPAPSTSAGRLYAF